MKCPFLIGKYLFSCAANQKEAYIPSEYEFEEYCKSRVHKMCSLYCKGVGERNIVCVDKDSPMIKIPVMREKGSGASMPDIIRRENE